MRSLCPASQSHFRIISRAGSPPLLDLARAHTHRREELGPLWRLPRFEPEIEMKPQAVGVRHQQERQRSASVAPGEFEFHSAEINDERPRLLHEVIPYIRGRPGALACGLVQQNDRRRQMDHPSESQVKIRQRDRPLRRGPGKAVQRMALAAAPLKYRREKFCERRIECGLRGARVERYREPSLLILDLSERRRTIKKKRGRGGTRLGAAGYSYRSVRLKAQSP